MVDEPLSAAELRRLRVLALELAAKVAKTKLATLNIARQYLAFMVGGERVEDDG